MRSTLAEEVELARLEVLLAVTYDELAVGFSGVSWSQEGKELWP
jgi:hypothetical protein